jgi:hypothetical protein
LIHEDGVSAACIAAEAKVSFSHASEEDHGVAIVTGRHERMDLRLSDASMVLGESVRGDEVKSSG